MQKHKKKRVMIALRHEADGTMTFQFAETVVRDLPEEDWDEREIRTVVGDLHNTVFAMCRQTIVGDIRPERFYIPLDADAPNPAGDRALRLMMWELNRASGPGGIPPGALVTLNTMREKGEDMGLGYAPFFESRLFTYALTLKWMPMCGDLHRHWKASGNADQFVRDVCYYAYVQFDPSVCTIWSPEQLAELDAVCNEASDRFLEVSRAFREQEIHTLIDEVMGGDQHNADTVAVSTAIEGEPPQPWRRANGESTLALLMRQKRLPMVFPGRTVRPAMIGRFNQLLEVLEKAIALSDAVQLGAYMRRRSRVHDKLAQVILSLPYLIHHNCMAMLQNYVRRYARLFVHFHRVHPRSIGGLCFFSQYLSETHMDMYLADLKNHIRTRMGATNPITTIITTQIEAVGDVPAPPMPTSQFAPERRRKPKPKKRQRQIWMRSEEDVEEENKRQQKKKEEEEKQEEEEEDDEDEDEDEEDREETEEQAQLRKQREAQIASELALLKSVI